MTPTTIDRKSSLSIADIADKADKAMAEVKQLVTTTKKTFFKEVTSDNIKDVIKSAEIQFADDYTEPTPCISIGDTPFARLGDFSVFMGKQKSRKTSAVTLLARCCINPNDNDLIKIVLPEDKRVLAVFDTEQSKGKSIQMLRKMCANDPELATRVRLFNLRAYSPKVRMQIIEEVLLSIPNVGIVIIDGIRDIVNDINNMEEATIIASFLLRLTEQLNIHIITVIHQNKNDTNARGNLGNELVNKAGTVASVEKDGEISIVSPVDCRDVDFQQFAFGIDQNNLPYVLGDYSPKEETVKAKKLTAYDIPKETHYKVLIELFGNDESMRYKDLESGLAVKFQSFSINLTHKQTTEFITYYYQQDILIKSGAGGRSGVGYKINHNHFK